MMKKGTIYLNANYWFDSSTQQDDLKNKSISGGISTTANQFISFGLNLISTFILARILLPADFGLVSMVTAFTGFAHIIKDLGLSTAVIQKEEITHGQVTKIFWINIAICFIIAGIFILVSPLIVSLYDSDKRIYPIIFAYAAGIVIGGFSLQHTALLCRKMLFSRIARGNILATLLGVSFGIGSALIGAGYWAIIILNISRDFFYTCFVWYFCNWRPTSFKQKVPVKNFIWFGVGLSGSNVVNYFSKNVDSILIGSMIGAAAVGFYSKAFQLLMLPINQLRTPLTLVATPALSALSKDKLKYINYYRKYLFILAFFSMPLVGCLAVFSKELILIVLGSQWIESSHIFRFLAFAGFILPVAQSRGLVMVTTGQTKRLFYMVAVLSAFTILGFFVGIHWGIQGVALSLPITTYLLLIPSLFYAFKNTPVKVSHFFLEIILPVTHTLATVCLLMILKESLSNLLSPLFVFLLLVPLAIIFYYYSWKFYPASRNKFANIEDVKQIFVEKIGEKAPTLARWVSNGRSPA